MAGIRNFFIVLFTLCCLTGVSIAEVPVLVPQIRHFANISSIAMHPNDKHVFSADEKGNIKQWEISSKKLVANIQSGLFSIDYVKVIGNGGDYKLLAYSQNLKLINIIDIDSNYIVKSIPFSAKFLQVFKSYYDSEDKLVLEIFSDRKRYWYDYKTFELKKEFPANLSLPTSGKYCFANVPNMLVYSEQGKIKIWKIWEKSDAFLVDLPINLRNEQVLNIKYAYAGYTTSYILVATDKAFYIYDIAKGKYRRVARIHRRETVPILIERNQDGVYYNLKHNQLAYSRLNKVFVLGEVVVPVNDLGQIRQRLMGLSEFDGVEIGTTNKTNQNLIIGYKGSELYYDFTEETEEDAFEATRKFGMKLQLPKAILSCENNKLLVIDRHLKEYNLNKAELTGEWFATVPNIRSIVPSSDNTIFVLVLNKLDYDATIFDKVKKKYVAGIKLNDKEVLLSATILKDNNTILLITENKSTEVYTVQEYNLMDNALEKVWESKDKILNLSINPSET